MASKKATSGACCCSSARIAAESRPTLLHPARDALDPALEPAAVLVERALYGTYGLGLEPLLALHGPHYRLVDDLHLGRVRDVHRLDVPDGRFNPRLKPPERPGDRRVEGRDHLRHVSGEGCARVGLERRRG